MPYPTRQFQVSCCATIVTICAMLGAGSTQAAPFQQIEDPQGLVWFIGTVEQITDGVPSVDLGEAHTLRTPGEARLTREDMERMKRRAMLSTPNALRLNDLKLEELPPGCRVVVVRNRNNRFSPLGLMNVQFTHPTWSEMERPTAFSPEVGDIVMFAAAPGELGSGATIRDSFVRHRIIANSNRNRYSTMRESTEANALQGIVEKQPTWVKGQRRLAGVIRSASVTKDAYVRLKPFINQIMMFQDYEDKGVQVSQVTSAAWQGVLDELRYKKDAFESTPTKSVETEAVEAGPAITTENKVDPNMLIAVKRIVNEVMFERFPEERDVIAVVCAALLQTKSSNERQWMGQQLTKSQFPELGNQEQVLVDMEGVMRRIRKTE